METHGIYLHIPFCRHRCSYCDFNTYAGLENLTADYTQALCDEIIFLAHNTAQPIPVETLFFGGGTPSLLTIQQIETILTAIRKHFALAKNAEITLEANPGTLSKNYLDDLFLSGVNRLSLGMQSAQPEELRLLERQHNTFDVLNTVSWARQAGFENINLDLIFGLPGQHFKSWASTLDLALQMQPEHLSLYALTLEHGTPMSHWVKRGQLLSPNNDQAAEMYEYASQTLANSGYAQYEISNWALPGRQCRHNLTYWRNQPYLGFGAGAHGSTNGFRTVNVLSPQAYIQRFNHASAQPFPHTPATINLTCINQPIEIQETLMMGFRLTDEGVSRSAFIKRFGIPIEILHGKTISLLIAQGLLENAGENQDRLRLTPRGRLLGNRVFSAFL